MFDVSSFYRVFICKDGFPFPWNLEEYLADQGSFERLFFAWSAALGKILIVDNFSKWHVIVVDKCCMCKMNGESVEHLPLYCEVVYALLNIIFNRFGLSWVMPSWVIDLFAHCGQVDTLRVLSVKDGTLLPLWCL